MTPKDKNNVTYFAETNFRNERKRFGIKRRDRARHTYIIGKTGMGKTTLLENMAAQDILNGEGIGIIDPHGDFAEKMLDFIPEERIEDVVYFAPHDLENPIGLNVMENVDPTQYHLVASGLLGVFKKIWPDVWSARMEYILSNCLLALLEYPDSTLLGINRMFSDATYRKEVVENITDSVVKAYWTDEFASYSEKFMTEATAAIQNKIGQFISNPLVRNIIGQSKSTFDIREIMDKKKILIMNLSKGRIGEENSRLLGALFITKIYLAAMSRVNVPEEDRVDFYLYVDEFQNFATESFADILSEARKYRLNLTLAHQYITQMEDTVRDAVFGNVGTILTFRVGATDADFLEKEFTPEFEAADIVNLGFAAIYLRLMVDGVASRPFSATTIPPIKPKEESHGKDVVELSREKYAVSREEIDRQTKEWYETTRSGKDGEGATPKKPMPQMFEAACSVCGKSTYVPFEPDGKRPIFCKSHREKRSAPDAEGKKPIEKKEIVDEKPKEETIKEMPEKEEIGERPPSTGSGQAKKETVEQKSTGTISLKDLASSGKGEDEKTDSKKKKEPKLDELKKVLEEVMADKKDPAINTTPNKEEKPTENSKRAKSGVLKPGDKIRFE